MLHVCLLPVCPQILMVWSRHFATSPWCQFELTYCLTHAMDTEDALVIVCIDDVTSSDDITSAMMAVLKTTTYIQWVGERQGRAAVDSFWGRLRVALNEVIGPGVRGQAVRGQAEQLV